MGAVQVLRKEAVRQRNQIEHTKTERALLQRIRHPFLVDLKCGPVVSSRTTRRVLRVRWFVEHVPACTLRTGGCSQSIRVCSDVCRVKIAMDMLMYYDSSLRQSHLA